MVGGRLAAHSSLPPRPFPPLPRSCPSAAPHPRHAKESACGCAGLFSAPVALALYAHAFEQAGALQHFEAFASFNGPDFYGLPRNTGGGPGACCAAAGRLRCWCHLPVGCAV